MLGIDDTYVLLGYLLCIGSTVLCAVYALLAWNRGQDAVAEEDVKWAKEEKEAEKEL